MIAGRTWPDYGRALPDPARDIHGSGIIIMVVLTVVAVTGYGTYRNEHAG